MKSLELRLEEARVHLEKRVPEVLAQLSEVTISPEEVSVTDYRLCQKLREILCAQNTLRVAVRSVLWDLIDAISFYIEVACSAWKHQSEASKHQYLTWVLAL